MQRLLRLCDGIAAAALAVLLAVVAVNVVGRALFDATGQALNLMIPGAIELSRYALLAVVFAALPRAAEVGMVRVDLAIERLPAELRGALERVAGHRRLRGRRRLAADREGAARGRAR